jgi:D-3-phosphoglycerate dehydrogenase
MVLTMAKQFKVAVTRDLLERTPDPWKMGLAWLREREDIAWSFFEEHRSEVLPEQVRGAHAVIAWTPRWTRASLEQADELLLIVRWGVGYDHLDVQGITDAGILLTITPQAVKKPVAMGNLAMLLSLSTGLVRKDRDMRSGIVWQEKSFIQPGSGLSGKVLGSIGLGNVATEMFRLAAPWGMKLIAHSPRSDPDQARLSGVELVGMDTLLRESDFLTVNCPLRPETYHLLGQSELGKMKSTAFLINLARGAIVDEAALIDALANGTIAGAGLDVFEYEPLERGHPLRNMDNVILTPHSLALTEELFAEVGKEHEHIVNALLAGKVPPAVVNKEVVESARFQEKWERLRNGISLPGTDMIQ